MTQVVDYSWGRVGGTDISHARAVAAAGYVGAIRYLCHPADGIKRLQAGELAALHGAGLAVGLVWETTADRAGQGRGAGTADAVQANAQADALGWPDDRPIFFAVDFDARPDQVAPYFAGAVATSVRPVGVYGHYGIVEAFAALPFRWQCAAWSGFGAGSGGSLRSPAERQGRRLSQHAQLYQHVGYVLGDTCDANDVLAPDWGGWHPDHPTPTTVPQEDDMPSLEEVDALVSKRLGEQDDRLKATIEAKLDAVLVNVDPVGVAAGTPGKGPSYLRSEVGAALAILQARNEGGGVDVQALAEQLAAALGPELGKQVVDELAKQLASGD